MIRAVIDFIKARGQCVSPIEPNAETFPDPDDKIFYCIALAAQDVGAALVTGNKRHFPNANFILAPSEFVALHASVL